MDAPKGRYRVEEKDGRLVVIDTLTGAPISSSAPSPTGITSPVERVEHGASSLGLFDRYARLLLHLVVNRWDDEGRALIRWEWEENGRKRRWDAALGAREQRRLARRLAGVAVFPLLILISVFGGLGAVGILLPFAFVTSAWGVWSIRRLMRGTGAES